jgi:uncharacterized membrane protein
VDAPLAGLPIEKSVRFGWDTFKKNVEFILAVEVAALFAEGVVKIGSALMENIGGFHEWAMSIAYFVVTMIIHLGAVKIALKYKDGERAEFANMFDAFGILPAFMAAAVLTWLAVSIGFAFLIVPGVVVAVRFWFCGFLVVDEELGPIEAIQRSVAITRGLGFDLFLFAMLLIGINLLGFLALGLGLFVSIPVTILAAAYVYRHLNPRPALESPRSDSSQPAPAPPAG